MINSHGASLSLTEWAVYSNHKFASSAPVFKDQEFTSSHKFLARAKSSLKQAEVRLVVVTHDGSRFEVSAPVGHGHFVALRGDGVADRLIARVQADVVVQDVDVVDRHFDQVHGIVLSLSSKASSAPICVVLAPRLGESLLNLVVCNSGRNLLPICCPDWLVLVVCAKEAVLALLFRHVLGHCAAFRLFRITNCLDLGRPVGPIER